ncbi:Trafficking protein particle complex subunit 5 [Larimichthys crocea]|uniref:Trafficking protein particle complex subunit 5 n=1 Tax=Larimichthys crocea TaxID=215358 RepID=A0A6G0JAP8_LARCR|nr:Trafficking protein particle complex subunit 5 [Larimichthys crocea]
MRQVCYFGAASEPTQNRGECERLRPAVLGGGAVLPEPGVLCDRAAGSSGRAGQRVGASLLDVLVLREKNGKRETKVLNILLFIKVSVWRALFGKEADKLEQANDDDKTYYIIEKEPLVNTYISVPKENSTLNCAAFTGGVVEAILTHSGFPAKVTVHWHKGTTLMIKFDEAVIARDKALEGR